MKNPAHPGEIIREDVIGPPNLAETAAVLGVARNSSLTFLSLTAQVHSPVAEIINKDTLLRVKLELEAGHVVVQPGAGPDCCGPCQSRNMAASD
ncbi:hypothetical protein [Nisaea sp.]|uniref:hypothetical protein n=1 Tax=Nisaea sp. TaxID=2024842 RepID=UPI0032EB013A